MDKNQAAHRFILGWRLQLEPSQGTAAWIAPDESLEVVTYAQAASIVTALAGDLDVEERAGRRLYLLRDDEEEAEGA